MLPAALPGVLVGARLSMTLALVLAIVAEMVGNPAGLGYAVVREQQAMRPELVFAYVVVIGALGVVLNAAAHRGRRRLVPGRLRSVARGRLMDRAAEQPGDCRTTAFRACEPSARARIAAADRACCWSGNCCSPVRRPISRGRRSGGQRR